MKRKNILGKKHRTHLRDMLFQGNELAVTQGGRSAPKVQFWITFFTRWWGVKMTSARAAHGDEWGQCLGDVCIKHSHKWGSKCSRQQALEEAAKKRYQTLRKLTQMEHKMPLRETSEVRMKPCPAETGYTKLQMDDRNISRRMQLPSAKFCKTCFPRHFSSAVSTNFRA